MWGGLLVASVAILAGCARRPHETKPVADPPRGDAGPARFTLVADEHRSVAEPCTRDAAKMAVPAGQGCQRDADCKGPGPAPRCVHDPRPRNLRNVCVSDDCQRDADCGAGVCLCGGDSPFGNHCLTGNCRVNADCASGACSPSVSVSPQGACGDARANLVGYFCHTPSDLCAAGSDCKSLPGTTCTFVSALGRWQCTANQQCPDG